MDCKTFETRIHSLLDRREDIADDPHLVEHATHCQTCRANWEGWRKLARVSASSPFGSSAGQAFPSLVLGQLSEETQLSEERQGNESRHDLKSKIRNPELGIFALKKSWACGVGLTAVMLLVGFVGVFNLLGTDEQVISRPAASIGDVFTDHEDLSGVDLQQPVDGLFDRFAWQELDYQSIMQIGGESISMVEPMARPIRLAYVLLQQGLVMGSQADESPQLDDERLTLLLDYVA